MNKKVIAIYARKSKATDKGESLKVQIEKCKQLASFKYSDFELEFIIYEEQEGKSGASLDRDRFKDLMKDITGRKRNIEILLVYKLDRLTRSVQDFTEIYEVLSAYGTEFISVKEDFDTTTPMGRAMLTITVVFAQLEREVIAERIQDAMVELAKTGRWLGGMTPFAYYSQTTTYINEAGQVKNKNHLEWITEETEILHSLYARYLELGSLSKVEAYLLEKNIKTRNEVDFRRYSIKFILTNPVYCCADKTAYEYFLENGYSIYVPKEKFDGMHGVMAYNKTISTKNMISGTDMKESRWRKKEDWIIAVGEHRALVTSEDWIKVQKLLLHNKENSYRCSRKTNALLSGYVKCNCGSVMRPKTSGNNTDSGEKAFYYLCEMKERSKGTRCKEANIAGNLLDFMVEEELFQLEEKILPIYHQTLPKFKKGKEDNEIFHSTKQNSIQNQIEKTQRYLDNINRAIRAATSEEAINDFTEQYQKYRNELKKLQIALQKKKENYMEVKEDSWILFLSHLNETFWKKLTYEQKKYAVKELIDEIKWDGTTVKIYLKGYQQEPITANPVEEQMNC
jgi:Site-specific recombinases, DNA invertase Pin homologs